MAHTKAQGAARNLKDSPGKRLGVKLFAGQHVRTGGIIVRQRGLSKVAGPGTEVGRDFTIFATRDGQVAFKKIQKTHFSGKRVPRTQVIVKD